MERFLQNRKIVHVNSAMPEKTRAIKGGFQLSRKFYMRTDVTLSGFTNVKKIRDDV